MSLRGRTRPGLGKVESYLPSPAQAPPAGPGWFHAIEHDGFRTLAPRDSAGVRLITRAGNDFSRLLSVHRNGSRQAAGSVVPDTGLAVFELIRRRGAIACAVHCAVDFIEFDGKDLRREPIERRKALLAKLLRGSPLRVVLDETFEEDGAIVCRAACRLGCEGIVSKRLGSRYRSGRSAHWVKVKNPKAPAVKREAEEDWGVASHRREET